MRSLCALFGFALLLSVGEVFAAEAPAAAGSKSTVVCPSARNSIASDYESLMITIWEDAPDYQATTTTYGVKIGVLGCFGAPVYGVEAAVIAAGSDDVTGFKGALVYTDGKTVSGLALAPVNFVDRTDGLAIGAVNVAKRGGVQVGILNFMENGFLPCFPIFNFGM